MIAKEDKRKIENKNKPNEGLAAVVTVTGVVGVTAGLIWYFMAKNGKRPGKQRFKKMAYYDKKLLKGLA